MHLALSRFLFAKRYKIGCLLIRRADVIMSLRRVFGVLLLGVFAATVSADNSKNESTPFTIFVQAPWQCKAGECKLNLTITQVNEGFWFSLDAEDKEYVAVALAGTAMMGRDNVIECQRSLSPNQSIEVYHSVNNGPPLAKGRSNARPTEQKIDTIAKNITGGTKDGRIFCSFILKPTTVFPNSTVNLQNTKYFLQIASGDSLLANRTGLVRHKKWATTLRAVSLVEDEGKLRTVDNVPVVCSSASSLTMSGFVLTAALILKTWL